MTGDSADSGVTTAVPHLTPAGQVHRAGGGIETSPPTQTPPARAQPAVPELPKIHLADVLCIGPIVAGVFYALLGHNILGDLINSQPLVVIAIRPGVTALLEVGALIHAGSFPLWVALLVPLPMMLFPDPFYFWAGRRYGAAFSKVLIEKDQRWARRIARAERLMERFGVGAIMICAIPVIPVPVTAVYFMAGTTKMRWRSFILADLAAYFLVIAGSLWLGSRLGLAVVQPYIDKITDFSNWIFWLSLLVVGVLVVNTVRRSLHSVREAAAAAGYEPHSHKRASVKRADILCITPIVLITIYQLFGLGLATVIAAGRPVALLAMRTSFPLLLSAGALVHAGTLPLWVALAAPFAYLFIGDPFFVWAGRRYGSALTRHYIRRNPRWEMRFARAEDLTRRWGFLAIVACGFPFIPIPTTLVLFAAGHARMRIPLIVMADVVSKAIFVGGAVWLGYVLDDHAQSVIDTITGAGARVLSATGLLVMLSILMAIRRRANRAHDQRPPHDSIGEAASP